MGPRLSCNPGGALIDVGLEAALRRLAHSSRLLVACDYDGTLSPIVDDPSAAVPYVPAVDALIGLAGVPNVRSVIISGRSLEALEALVNAPPSVTLIGDHGAQLSESDHGAPGTIAAVTDALAEAAEAFDGAAIEPKPLGAAFHYRHVVAAADAASAARTIGAKFDARIIEGKHVVEIVVGVGDKGSAINQVRESGSYDGVVFFGDDVTDEDVFATLSDDDVGVKVGEGRTRARYRVADPAQVAEALEKLRSELRSLNP